MQEGEQPPEDPIALLAEHDRLYLRLLELVQSINRTNAGKPFDERRSISDAIAERDLTGKKRDHLVALAAQRTSAYSAARQCRDIPPPNVLGSREGALSRASLLTRGTLE